jgi:hypothetical protein
MEDSLLLINYCQENVIVENCYVCSIQYVASLHCKEKIDLSISNYQTEIPAIFQGIFRIFCDI